MYFQDLAKKLYILTEVCVCYRYSPDVTHCVFFFSLTIVPFSDRLFKACLHLQFQNECTKYAYILVQQGKVYKTGGLVLKFVLFCSPEVYRVVLPQSIALNRRVMALPVIVKTNKTLSKVSMPYGQGAGMGFWVENPPSLLVVSSMLT